MLDTTPITQGNKTILEYLGIHCPVMKRQTSKPIFSQSINIVETQRRWHESISLTWIGYAESRKGL